MAVATVAYEGRRKKQAVRPLRWHRSASGLEAKGVKGKYAIVQRRPDRRHGVFPWSLRGSGPRGTELKAGGFDLVAQAKEFAAMFDAGLCGGETVQGLPNSGVYKGTLAGEAHREPSDSYEKKVIAAVAKMVGQEKGPDGTLLPTDPDAYQIVGNSPEYVAQMEQGGIDPEIVAAVLIATKVHRHVHDVPGKHVELSEAAEGGSKAFRHAKDILAMYGITIQKTGFDDYRVYPIGNRDPEFGYFTDDLDDAIATGIDMAGRIRRGEGMADWVGEAAEAKKRLWQPDPSSGLFITKSSLTRDYWLVKGKHIEGRYPTRGEAETAARGMVDGAAEARRPKGRSRR
jgi:hypothetical protein